jgi:hypothetical protein
LQLIVSDPFIVSLLLLIMSDPFIVLMTLSCGGFYGTMVGFVAKIIFDLQENDMWLFVALPVERIKGSDSINAFGAVTGPAGQLFNRTTQSGSALWKTWVTGPDANQARKE